MFTPHDELECAGVLTPSCVTACDNDGNVVLIMENHNFHPITLNEGEMLGEVEVAMIIPPGSKSIAGDTVQLDRVSRYYHAAAAGTTIYA